MQNNDEIKAIMDNFDEENIENIRKSLDLSNSRNEKKRKFYTMVQDNAPCAVTVKESSRKKCVESLLK